jgi:uncharacterized protein YegL
MRHKSWVVALVVGGLVALMLSNNPAEAADVPSVTSMDVAISINNSYAVTRVGQVIANPSATASSATFNFQVPEEAFISNFSLGLDGRTYYGQVVPAQNAKESYDRAVSEGRNAGLLASRGRSLFSYSINLKAGQSVDVGLVFEQFLRMKGGAFEYSMCLDSAMFGGATPSMNISSSIAYCSAIESVAVENYTANTSILRPSPMTASTGFSARHFAARGNYIIRYSIARAAAAGSITPCYDGRDTYFMHVFEPGVLELGGSPMPKQVVFVLDRSGSMSGQKIEQVKTAFGGIVRQLRPEDSFNFVYFSTNVAQWRSSPVKASKENIEAAESEIEGISASGSTNFNGAVGTALQMIKDQKNAAAIVVMLTDGQPTSGVTDKSTIRSEARSKNTLGTPIYCLGFGNDVDFDFLKALSIESGARALRIYIDKDAAGQIRDFFTTVADPLMKDLTFTYFPGAEDHILGGKCLYDGSQLVVVGKVSGRPSALSVQVSGTDRDGPARFDATVDLTAMAQDPMVVRFYDFARINELLDRITVEGSGSPLVAEATNLSVEHGFVTPYTSMLIDIGEQKKTDQSQWLGDSGAPAPALASTRKPSAVSGGLAPYGSELIPLALAIGLVVAALRRRLK